MLYRLSFLEKGSGFSVPNRKDKGGTAIKALTVTLLPQSWAPARGALQRSTGVSLGWQFPYVHPAGSRFQQFPLAGSLVVPPVAASSRCQHPLRRGLAPSWQPWVQGLQPQLHPLRLDYLLARLFIFIDAIAEQGLGQHAAPHSLYGF